MKKIISLFQRNYEGDRLVRDEIVPGAEWVVAGEGVATEKIDGTACLIEGGKLYKRYDAKHGKKPPEGWKPCEDAPDEHTGHWPGWLPIGDGPEDKWHREAWQGAIRVDGSVELIGPKVQGNPYQRPTHIFRYHGDVKLPDTPRTYVEVKAYLADHAIEGIVWHHPDGRMVKIKARDFGLRWPQ